MKTFVLLLAVILSTQTLEDHGRVLHVHKLGNDVEECLLGSYYQNHSQPNQFCHSIEFIAKELGNNNHNITIVLENQIQIRYQIIFKDYDFLSIQGQKKIIRCNCKYQEDNIGLSFIRIKKL